jgi:hypothetical protein
VFGQSADPCWTVIQANSTDATLFYYQSLSGRNMTSITVPRDVLLLPLQSVSGVVERRHTLPILSNVLLELQGDQLTLTATDLELQVASRTQTTAGSSDHATTVSARKLQYGEQIVVTLSRQLMAEFGRGFEEKNLRRMMQFAERIGSTPD